MSQNPLYIPLEIESKDIKLSVTKYISLKVIYVVVFTLSAWALD